ncbi:ATP-sensitive inward rectifier potassium channel 11-like isoform X1 [Euwallacea fornicatus]|uniref:ATP-sensitive inward rectifier potassium channel 11-like isoform X1 n=2 Tax=Euwallacea fornicatus TaxID=995702 RepID=UPI00338E0726
MTIWDVRWLSQKAEDVRGKTWIPWKSRKMPRRAIFKDGRKNVYRKKMSSMRRWKFLQDIFTTLLDAQWRWTLQFLALEFFGSWLIFALVWWLIAFTHGDLHEDHLPLRQAESGWTPCVVNIHGFHSAFLYSLETQHTTGYGLRVITEECPEAIFLMVCQCLIGMTLDSFAISIVFAKLIRSKHATNTVQFSRNGVISRRDGKLCFMFRVGDIRRSRLAAVNVRAILLKSERTREGELLQSYQNELSLKADEGPRSLFMVWPLTIYHEIDENSPIMDLTVPELRKGQRVEIIVVLDATVESTGVSIEAKSSYLSHEILWNHTFEPMVSFNREENCYEADWSKFDQTRVVNTHPTSLDEDADNETESPEVELLVAEQTDGKNELYLPLQFAEEFLKKRMIDSFEDEDDEFPIYQRPTGPELEKLRNTRSPSQMQNLKFNGYGEAIEECDESCEDLLCITTV